MKTEDEAEEEIGSRVVKLFNELQARGHAPEVILPVMLGQTVALIVDRCGPEPLEGPLRAYADLIAKMHQEAAQRANLGAGHGNGR